MGRVLSVHQEHELLLKLEQAGLSESDAQAIIESRDNVLAHSLVALVRGNSVGNDWFAFTTSELTLRELLEQNPDLFYQTNEAWWWNETFATEKGEVRQLQLRTSAVPGSFGKTWDEQRRLVPENELAKARDVVDGIVQYYRQTGKRLFPDFYVRCQDISSFGSRVYVGCFDSGGLIVSDDWDSDRDSRFGLASARNFS